MSWGGLNLALTSWRNGINARLPNRGTASDGGVADQAHSSSSEHQRDADGSVDAFDCDVNFLGSGEPTGTAAERRIAEALKLDFEADRRSHLWIHRGEIANEAVRSFAERAYAGANPHDKHIHFESEQRYERDGSPWRFTRTDALLREMQEDGMPSALEVAQEVARQLNMSPGPQGGVAVTVGDRRTFGGGFDAITRILLSTAEAVSALAQVVSAEAAREQGSDAERDGRLAELNTRVEQLQGAVADLAAGSDDPEPVDPGPVG